MRTGYGGEYGALGWTPKPLLPAVRIISTTACRAFSVLHPPRAFQQGAVGGPDLHRIQAGNPAGTVEAHRGMALVARQGAPRDRATQGVAHQNGKVAGIA